MDIKQAVSPEQLLKTLQVKQETLFFKKALKLYVPPQVQVGRFLAVDKPQDAAQAIVNWLNNSDKKCLLLLGDSGVGKTLFGQWITLQSFSQNLQGRISLFISLLAQNNPSKNLIENYLKMTCGIENEVDREWIKQQPLLLILDGFDEIHQEINLYRSNKLWQLKDVKIIISCRSQALANSYNYAELFYPYDHHDNPQPYQLEECIVNPFTKKQINVYLQQYVGLYQDKIKVSHSDWVNWETYQSAIKNLPGLQALLTSPFVLSIAVKILPFIIAKYEHKDGIEQRYLTLINLYEHFVEQWFARQKKKLVTSSHISNDYPIEELFAKCSKAIANAMLQAKVNSIELTSHKIVPLLGEQSFFSNNKLNIQTDDVETQLRCFDEGIDIEGKKIKLSVILSGCPMMEIQKNRYAFIHTSLLDYFAARKLFEGVMVDASIALGYELSEKLIVDESEMLKFLAERVKQDDMLKQRLFDVLKESKFEDRIEIAAANAITILNYAKISFSGKELHHIRIKGADLSYAILDNTNLQYADLREVNFDGAWLNNTKMADALMQKAKFGEFPCLNAEEPICCIAYSPDGKFLAVGTMVGTIRLWEFATNRWMPPFKGHKASVKCVAFSPDGSCFASGSEDRSVRLWGIEDQRALGVLNGHRGTVLSVAFKPEVAFRPEADWCYIYAIFISEKLIEDLEKYKGSYVFDFMQFIFLYITIDGEIEEVEVYDYDKIFSEVIHMMRQTFDRMPIKFSRKKLEESVKLNEDHIIKLIASGSEDKSIVLWDVINLKPFAELNGHKGSVTSVVFSHAGNYIISGSLDKSVCFWDFKNRKPIAFLDLSRDLTQNVIFNSANNPVFTKFNIDYCVNSIALSPDGSCFACDGCNNAVYLWDIENQRPLGELKGHTSRVTNVAFSPDGKILASGSADNSVRLWDIESQKSLGVLNGHTDVVTSVAFSPDGSLTSHSLNDNSIRFWDFRKQKLEAVRSSVSSIALNPNGGILAVGSFDKRGFMNLYDVKTQKSLDVLEGHIDAINSVAFSSDGKILASGSDDNFVRVWFNDGSWKSLQLEGHTKYVNSVAFSPNGRFLASGGEDNSVRIWDINDVKERGSNNFPEFSKRKRLPPDRINSLLDAIGEEADDVYQLSELIRITRGEIEYSIIDGNNYYTADFINLLLFPLSKLNDIKVYPAITDTNLNDYYQKLSEKSERYAFIPLNIAYDEKVLTHKNHWAALVIDNKNGLIFYLDPARKAGIHSNVESLKDALSYTKPIIMNPVDFQANEKTEGWIRHCGVYIIEIFSVFANTKQCISGGVMADPGIPDSIPVQTPLSSIYCGEADNIKKLRKSHIQTAYGVVNPKNVVEKSDSEYDPETRTSESFSEVLIKNDCQFVGENRRIVMTFHRGRFPGAIFNPESLKFVNDNSLEYITGSSSLAAVGGNNTSCIVFKAGDSVTSIAFSPDSCFLAAGSENDFVYLWNIKNKSHEILKGHSSAVKCVTFSPDGNYLASGGMDKSVRLWDTSSNRTTVVLSGHTEDGVWCLAFSPDNRYLASGGMKSSRSGGAKSGCSVRLWDVKTRKCLGILNLTSNIVSLLFKREGEKIYLYVGSSNAVYYYEIKNIQLTPSFILIWKIGDDAGLMAEQLDLGGVIGLEQTNERLLKQYKAVGNLSQKETHAVLQARSQRVPYNPAKPIYDLFSGQHLITPNNSIVSEYALNLICAQGLPNKANLEKGIYLFRDGSPENIYALVIYDNKEYQSFNLTHDYSIKHDIKNLVWHDNKATQDKYIAVTNEKLKKYIMSNCVRTFEYGNAVVTMARSKKGKGDNHVFLVIEHIEDNHYVIIRADLFLDKKQKRSEGLIFSSGQALIEICVKPRADMQELVGQCIYKSWKITNDQISALLANLGADRSKRIKYLNVGNDLFYTKPNEETHNCLTWCENHLSNIGIDVSSQKSWLDPFVKHPEYHLPDNSGENDDNEPNPGENCLVM